VPYVGVLISFWLSLFPICSTTKEFFLDGLKKLQQRSHKCVELRGEYVEYIHFFSPIACCFLYKAKDLTAPLVYSDMLSASLNKALTGRSPQAKYTDWATAACRRS
jgi:hypothetical protein